jgi:hypothetical protein
MEATGQLHVLALAPRKEPAVPTEQEIWWALEPVWMLWRGESLLDLQEIEDRFSVVQPVAQSLYRLSYPGSSDCFHGNKNITLT